MKNVSIKLSWADMNILKTYIEGVINAASRKSFDHKLIVASLHSLLKKVTVKSMFYRDKQSLSMTPVEALALHQSFTSVLPMDNITIRGIVAVINQKYI